jgi:hypothetical protein
MEKITLDAINDINDVNILYQLEQKFNHDISLITKPNVNEKLIDILAHEAFDYGINTLKEYIEIKLNNILKLKEACINRSIYLSKSSII